ncbi:MAG: hypothetical protein GX455_06630, partial [Phycisphaerae bacterium]|nr:hypothetical protein [Phycisphaerae bacterium]
KADKKHQSIKVDSDRQYDRFSPCPNGLESPSGGADNPDSQKRLEMRRNHAFEYARRIVISSMTGVLDGEGLYFDVVGLRRNSAEGFQRPVSQSGGTKSSIHLFGYSGPLDVVIMWFCEEIGKLCAPCDIPDPLTPDGLRKWATAAQQNIRSRFSGWGLKVIRDDLDAITVLLAENSS